MLRSCRKPNITRTTISEKLLAVLLGKVLSVVILLPFAQHAWGSSCQGYSGRAERILSDEYISLCHIIMRREDAAAKFPPLILSESDPKVSINLRLSLVPNDTRVRIMKPVCSRLFRFLCVLNNSEQEVFKQEASRLCPFTQ